MLSDFTKDFLKSISIQRAKGHLHHGIQQIKNPISVGAQVEEFMYEYDDSTRIFKARYGWYKQKYMKQLEEEGVLFHDNKCNTMAQYHGELNHFCQPHGYGHVSFNDGRIFMGTFKDGLAHGFGILRASN